MPTTFVAQEPDSAATKLVHTPSDFVTPTELDDGLSGGGSTPPTTGQIWPRGNQGS